MQYSITTTRTQTHTHGLDQPTSFFTQPTNQKQADDEPALPKRKLVSLWSMLVKNMELHKFQIQQVLYQQRAELAKRGTEIPDEHIGGSWLALWGWGVFVCGCVGRIGWWGVGG